MSIEAVKTSRFAAADQALIKKKLNEINSHKCIRCGGNDITLVDGWVAFPVLDDPRSMTLGGPVIPTVATACTKCGLMQFYSAILLGLMPGQDEGKA